MSVRPRPAPGRRLDRERLASSSQAQEGSTPFRRATLRGWKCPDGSAHCGSRSQDSCCAKIIRSQSSVGSTGSRCRAVAGQPCREFGPEARGLDCEQSGRFAGRSFGQPLEFAHQEPPGLPGAARCRPARGWQEFPKQVLLAAVPRRLQAGNHRGPAGRPGPGPAGPHRGAGHDLMDLIEVGNHRVVLNFTAVERLGSWIIGRRGQRAIGGARRRTAAGSRSAAWTPSSRRSSRSSAWPASSSCTPTRRRRSRAPGPRPRRLASSPWISSRALRHGRAAADLRRLARGGLDGDPRPSQSAGTRGLHAAGARARSARHGRCSVSHVSAGIQRGTHRRRLRSLGSSSAAIGAASSGWVSPGEQAPRGDRATRRPGLPPRPGQHQRHDVNGRVLRDDEAELHDGDQIQIGRRCTAHGRRRTRHGRRTPSLGDEPGGDARRGRGPGCAPTSPADPVNRPRSCPYSERGRPGTPHQARDHPGRPGRHAPAGRARR